MRILVPVVRTGVVYLFCSVGLPPLRARSEVPHGRGALAVPCTRSVTQSVSESHDS